MFQARFNKLQILLQTFATAKPNTEMLIFPTKLSVLEVG